MKFYLSFTNFFELLYYLVTLKLKLFNILACSYSLPAEVPGAARVNLQPAEDLKNVLFTF